MHPAGSRRAALRQLIGGLATAVVAACRPGSHPDSGLGSTVDSEGGGDGSSCLDLPHGDGEDGWVAVSLAEYPELEDVGGQAAVDVDEALLHVLVAHERPDCYIAVWRVCTHGTCEVSWDPSEATVVCPCHDSRFDVDGTVLTGPATEPLEAFETVRDGDTLWIHRPL